MQVRSELVLHEKDRRELRELFDTKCIAKTILFMGRLRVADAIYVEPKFVAEIEFRGWTGKNASGSHPLKASVLIKTHRR